MRAIFSAATLAVLALGGCDESFDKARWAEGAGGIEDLDNPRASMLGAARAAGVRPGATRERVRDLLGEPDTTSDRHDSYWLGIEPFGVDTHYMNIKYDDTNKVVSIDFVHG